MMRTILFLAIVAFSLAAIAASGFTQPPPPIDQQVRWPTAKELRSHLRDEHQTSVDGLTDAQCVALHESMHESIEALRPKGVYSYIVAETREDCLPCQRWKLEVQPMLRKNGWQVVYRRGKKSVPAFFVVVGKTHYGHVGYLTTEKLRSIVSGVK